MKSCIITVESAREKNTWSGTPKNIIDCFKKKNVKVENLSYYKKIHHYGLGKIKKIIDKFFYTYGSGFFDPFPFWYNINANYFEKNMLLFDVDSYMFMGEHCLKNRKKIKGNVYVYLDREITEIIKFDEDKRIFKREFERGYAKNFKRSIMCMDHVFTLNEWSRRKIISKYNFPQDKITNVGFGVNLKPYQGEKDYTNHKILIVLRKGTEHYKGLDLLLEAFEIARNRITDLTLHVVGTDYRKVDGVYYYYDNPRSVTVSLFQECSLYAMPALLEPNGITYLEALANKVPIVGMNRFAYPEFCGYGKYGFIVEEDSPMAVANVLVKAFSDIGMLKLMGINGQKYVIERFTWEKTANKMLTIMKEDI